MIELARATFKIGTNKLGLVKLLVGSTLFTFMSSSEETNKPDQLTPNGASIALKRLIDCGNNIGLVTPWRIIDNAAPVCGKPLDNTNSLKSAYSKAMKNDSRYDSLEAVDESPGCVDIRGDMVGPMFPRSNESMADLDHERDLAGDVKPEQKRSSTTIGNLARVHLVVVVAGSV